jgi:4-hydroxybenzoate polyprenyltransferase
MLAAARNYLSLIRFSHTVFALPFALLAAAMAWRLPTWQWVDMATMPQLVGPRPEFGWRPLAGIVLCMATARSAAMAFNRLVDRRLDAANSRTAGRHLPAGIMSVRQVAAFVAASSAAFVATTLLFLPNRLPLYLAAPVLAFLLGYSYAKRFTALAHFWLGAALALTPIAAWIAIRGETVMDHALDLLPALVLGGTVWSWVAGFDIIYACQDVEFDRRARLHSVPVRLGVAGALRLAAACHLATIGLLAALPLVYPPFGWIYWIGIAAVAGLLAYEHALVRPDDLARVNTAFFHVNAVISLGLLAVGTVDLWLS